MYSETLSGPQSRNKFSWEIQLGTSVDVTKAKAFSGCVLAVEFWDFFWPCGTVSVHLRMIVMHNSNRSLPTEFDAKYRRYQRKKFKFPVLLLSSVGSVRIWGQNRGAEEEGGLWTLDISLPTAIYWQRAIFRSIVSRRHVNCTHFQQTIIIWLIFLPCKSFLSIHGKTRIYFVYSQNVEQGNSQHSYIENGIRLE